MDELELRVAAHEMALIEVAANLREAELLAAIEQIRDGLEGSISGEERTVRLQAISLLEDALHRHDPPGRGLFIGPAGGA